MILEKLSNKVRGGHTRVTWIIKSQDRYWCSTLKVRKVKQSTTRKIFHIYKIFRPKGKEPDYTNPQTPHFTGFMSLPLYPLLSTQPYCYSLHFSSAGIKCAWLPNTGIKGVKRHHLDLFLDRFCVAQGDFEEILMTLSLSPGVKGVCLHSLVWTADYCDYFALWSSGKLYLLKHKQRKFLFVLC